MSCCVPTVRLADFFCQQANAALATSALVPLLSDWALPDANIHAIYLERNQLSVKLRTFVDFLGERLPRQGGMA
jgi:DNA-binding transcriptional LysR family regulator